MRPSAVPWAAALAALLLTSISTACGATLRLHSAPARYLRNQHVQERATELYNAYRSRLVTLPARPRKLIFTCNSAALCGGLGDRLKGLASTFVLAVLTDAEFMVDWEEPVPLRTFFALDQRLPTDVAAVRMGAANATDFGFIDVHMYPSELHRLRNINFAALWAGNDVVNVRWNGAVWNHLVLNDHLWPVSERYGLQKLSKRQVFEAAMYLFFSKPTRELAAVADESLNRLTGVPLKIGVQMRMGGGEWADPTRYQGASLEHTVGCFVSETVRTCGAGACAANCSVFLTTDSGQAQAVFAAALAPFGIPVVASAGAISHLEHSATNASEHMKTFADWYALTRMARLVASRSGFAETAAWAGNIPSRALVKAPGCLFSNGVEVPDGAEY